MNANKLTTAQFLEILECDPDEKDRDNVRNAWKKLCRQHHPTEKMTRRKRCKRQRECKQSMKLTRH